MPQLKRRRQPLAGEWMWASARLIWEVRYFVSLFTLLIFSNKGWQRLSPLLQLCLLLIDPLQMLLARLEVILGRTRLVGWEVPMVEECEQLEVSKSCPTLSPTPWQPSCLVYNFPLSEKNGFARFNIQQCVEEIFCRKSNLIRLPVGLMLLKTISDHHPITC